MNRQIPIIRLTARAALLGLITSLLAAWLPAAVHDMWSEPNSAVALRRPEGTATGPDMVVIERSDRWGAVAWTTSYRFAVANDAAIPAAWGRPMHIPGWAGPYVRSWEARGEDWPGMTPPAFPYAIEVGMVRAYGWPFRAVHWRSDVVQPAAPPFVWRTSGALAVPWLRSRDGFARSTPLLLPYFPVWAGLAGNVALFSLCWLGLLFAWRGLRRSRRRRRGLCPECRYDLAGTEPGRPCPECGTR